MTATATLPTPNACCSLCGLPAPFCPCDRRDIFRTPNTPLRVEHFTLTDDGRFIPTPDDNETPEGPSEAECNAMMDEAAELYRRESEEFRETEEYEPNPYDGTYFEC